MKRIFLNILFVFTVFTTSTLHGQSNADDNLSSYKLIDDTLHSVGGQKIYIGQKLAVGKPYCTDGNYLSIISKKAAIVPSLWGQNKNYEYAIQNYVDSKKNKGKLTQFLKSTETLTVKKIILEKAAKPNFYMVLLSSSAGDCKADIQLAIDLKELILLP